MPKFTVYVPDDLWNDARAISGDKNPSQLIQYALRGLLDDLESALFATEPTERDRAANVAAKKAVEARKAYAAGYNSGLDLAEAWPWDALDWLAEQNFDLERLNEPDWPYALVVIAPEEVGVVDRGKLFLVGVRQALRDVWEAVLAARADEAAAAEPDE